MNWPLFGHPKYAMISMQYQAMKEAMFLPLRAGPKLIIGFMMGYNIRVPWDNEDLKVGFSIRSADKTTFELLWPWKLPLVILGRPNVVP